jgi:hypothetical protein
MPQGIYDEIREFDVDAGRVSIERMCQLACVRRAGFYRSLQEREPVEEDMEVGSTIQTIFAEHKRRSGYRRVSAAQQGAGESQAGGAADARGGSHLGAAGSVTEIVRGHDGFRARAGGLSQSGKPNDADRN